MGLKYTGTALAVNTRDVESRDGSFANYVQTTIVAMDQGKVTEIRTGRDFAPSDVARLKDALKNGQPGIEVAVFASQKGALYAESLLSLLPVKSPAHAG